MNVVCASIRVYAALLKAHKLTNIQRNIKYLNCIFDNIIRDDSVYNKFKLIYAFTKSKSSLISPFGPATDHVCSMDS